MFNVIGELVRSPPELQNNNFLVLVITFPSSTHLIFCILFFQKSTGEVLKAQSAGVIKSAAPPHEKKRKVEKV